MKNQDKINYMFFPPKNETNNSKHFIVKIENDSTDFKKDNLASKVRKDKTKKQLYFYKEKTQDTPKDSETNETIKILDEIATLEPGKNAQLAAKKVSEKYKKIREANAKKQKYKLPGEIVTIETVETPQGEVKVQVSIEKPIGSKKTAKKIIKKCDKIMQEKKIKKTVDANEKRKKTKKLDSINEIKNSAAKKSAKITAKKIVEKYKSMKRPKKTYLVNEKDYPQEDLFREESIVEAANKVLDFEAFKKDQAKALNKTKKRKKDTILTAKKISQKYKNLKKPKKTFLVNEDDLQTIDYDEPKEDLFKGESLVEAANKVLDFEAFKKQQEAAINDFNLKLSERRGEIS